MDDNSLMIINIKKADSFLFPVDNIRNSLKKNRQRKIHEKGNFGTFLDINSAKSVKKSKIIFPDD